MSDTVEIHCMIQFNVYGGYNIAAVSMSLTPFTEEVQLEEETQGCFAIEVIIRLIRSPYITHKFADPWSVWDFTEIYAELKAKQKPIPNTIADNIKNTLRGEAIRYMTAYCGNRIDDFGDLA